MHSAKSKVVGRRKNGKAELCNDIDKENVFNVDLVTTSNLLSYEIQLLK